MAETATRTAPERGAKRRSVRGNKPQWIKSDIELGLDPDLFGPTAFAARPVGDITGNYETQEFELDEDRARFVHFTQPNQNLPSKRLYTVKAMKPNGTLTQLPFEPQINNSAAGDQSDAIGLRRYERKGYKIFVDWESLQPLYCAAFGCFARSLGSTAEYTGNFPHFCGQAHAQLTLPNMYRDAGRVNDGLMAQGATTSRVWGS